MASGPGLTERLATAQAAQGAGQALAPADGGKLRVVNVATWLQHPDSWRKVGSLIPRANEDDVQRWKGIIYSEIQKNPKLLEANHTSFGLAVQALAVLALEPGPLGHAYLTGPFNNSRTGIKEVVPILGYKGLIELAYRAGTVDLIDAVPVREGEPFRIVRGSDMRLEHEELRSCAGNAVVAYYAIAFPKGSGRPVFEIMWPDEIESIRKRSKAKDSGPWKDDYEAMALKTPIRRMLNRGKVRLTPQVANAIAEDEAREFGYERQDVMTGEQLAGLAGGAEEAAPTDKAAAAPQASETPAGGAADSEEQEPDGNGEQGSLLGRE